MQYDPFFHPSGVIVPPSEMPWVMAADRGAATTQSPPTLKKLKRNKIQGRA
jgi:hypothetical protein